MSKQIKYGQYCPIAAAAEIVAERWTPLILRGLFAGLHRFNELHASMPRISTALLSNRLLHLEHKQVVERRHIGPGKRYKYYLTESGQALWPVLEQMGNWSQTWLRDRMTSPGNIDLDLFFWEVRHANMASGRTVRPRRAVEVRLTDTEPHKGSRWMVFDGGDIDVCKKDPGFEIDLWVTGSVQDLVRVWMGHVRLSHTIETGAIILHGSRKEVERFGTWFTGSGFQAAGLTAIE